MATTEAAQNGRFAQREEAIAARELGLEERELNIVEDEAEVKAASLLADEIKLRFTTALAEIASVADGIRA